LQSNDEDAQADGVTRQELIGQRKQIIELAIAEYRRAAVSVPDRPKGSSGSRLLGDW